MEIPNYDSDTKNKNLANVIHLCHMILLECSYVETVEVEKLICYITC